MTHARGAVTPYLLVNGATKLLDFCTDALGAKLLGKLDRPDGTLMHAELAIGDGAVMLGEPMGEFEEMTGAIFLRVDDCDQVYADALAAGAVSVMDVTTLTHAGERYGGVRDPWGNVWWISTHLEDIAWDEQQRRIDALVEQGLGRE